MQPYKGAISTCTQPRVVPLGYLHTASKPCAPKEHTARKPSCDHHHHHHHHKYEHVEMLGPMAQGMGEVAEGKRNTGLIPTLFGCSGAACLPVSVSFHRLARPYDYNCSPPRAENGVRHSRSWKVVCVHHTTPTSVCCKSCNFFFVVDGCCKKFVMSCIFFCGKSC